MPDKNYDFSDFYVSEPQESVKREEQEAVANERRNLANLSPDDIEGSDAATIDDFAAGSYAAQRRAGAESAEPEIMPAPVKSAGDVDYRKLLEGGWDDNVDAPVISAGKTEEIAAGSNAAQKRMGQVAAAGAAGAGGGDAPVQTEGATATTGDGTGFTKEQIVEQGAGTDGKSTEGTGNAGATGSGAGVAGGTDVVDDAERKANIENLTRAQRAAQYWETAENQTYQGLRDYLAELDREDEKRRNRSNWWELMVRGLTGGLNIAGTAAGAPSMDFTDSKEAFSKADTDAYARLKDKKTQAIQLAQKRMEQMEKQREAARKAYADERSYKIKMDNLELQRKRLQEIIDKNDDEQAVSQAKIKLIEVNTQIAEAKRDHQQTQFALEDDVKKSVIGRNDAAAKKTGSGGAAGVASREQKKKDNEYIGTIRSLASRADAKKITSVYAANEWYLRHKNNKQAKAAYDKYNR